VARRISLSAYHDALYGVSSIAASWRVIPRRNVAAASVASKRRRQHGGASQLWHLHGVTCGVISAAWHINVTGAAARHDVAK